MSKRPDRQYLMHSVAAHGNPCVVVDSDNLDAYYSLPLGSTVGGITWFGAHNAWHLALAASMYVVVVLQGSNAHIAQANVHHHSQERGTLQYDQRDRECDYPLP